MAINNNESEKLQYQTGVSPLKSASVFVLQRLWAHTRSLWVARKTEFHFFNWIFVVEGNPFGMFSQELNLPKFYLN